MRSVLLTIAFTLGTAAGSLMYASQRRVETRSQERLALYTSAVLVAAAISLWYIAGKLP